MTPQEKSFCALEFSKCESTIQVKQRFYQRFIKQSPRQKIYEWHRKFVETGFICKKIPLGRHRTCEDVQLIQESFSRSPVKYKANASIELGLPKTIEWRVLKKRLNLKPYKLPLLHALCPNDHNKSDEFCADMLEDKANEGFSERLGVFL